MVVAQDPEVRRELFGLGGRILQIIERQSQGISLTARARIAQARQMNETIRSNRIPKFRCRRLASFSRYCRRGFLRMRAPKRYKAHTVRPLPAGLRIEMSR